MKATDFSGTKCGQRFEKEYEDKFRDCLSFYFDNKIIFERFCYGEGACLVYSVSATMNENGDILYKSPINPIIDQTALPKKLTNFGSDILYFDESPKKWSLSYVYKTDKLNGYTSLKCLFKNLKL